YVYARFEDAYKNAMGGGKLGSRRGVESRPNNNPIVLPLTGSKSNYDIPNGFIFPLLASFRALVGDDANGRPTGNPVRSNFFDDSGPELVQVLIEQVDSLGGIPDSQIIYWHDKPR